MPRRKKNPTGFSRGSVKIEQKQLGLPDECAQIELLNEYAEVRLAKSLPEEVEALPKIEKAFLADYANSVFRQFVRMH